METENSMRNDGVSLTDVFRVIKNHIIAVIAIFAAFCLLGVVYAKLQKPTYRSEGSIMAAYDSTKYNDDGKTTISTEYTLSRYILPTIVSMMKEDRVLDATVEKLKAMKERGEISENEPISNAALRSNLTVSRSDEEDLLIKVSYVASSPEDAQIILSAVIESTIEVADSLDDYGKPVYKLLSDNIKVFSAAGMGKKANSSTKYVIIFAVLGIVVAAAYVFIRELFNNKFKTVAEVEATLDIPVFAAVPEYEFTENSSITRPDDKKTEVRR